MELTSPTELVKDRISTVQDYILFCGQAVANIFRKPLYFSDMVQQSDAIGVGSLPIVVLTGFFTGAVLALQAANTLERFGSISMIGELVSTSMVRELGPVLTSLMVAGRNSSGMASELGSMVVTEQIDAMRALGTDPMKKLVTPRVVATVFMLFF
ncbi:MAG: ABC transporter permease, partial [Candidatus Sulfotelmatobacter sp.]